MMDTTNLKPGDYLKPDQSWDSLDQHWILVKITEEDTNYYKSTWYSREGNIVNHGTVAKKLQNSYYFPVDDAYILKWRLLLCLSQGFAPRES